MSITPDQRQEILEVIAKREVLRPLTRTERLLRAPWRTAPYYILATLSHIKPFPISFKTLWETKMSSYLPEGNTFYYYGYCEANVTSFLLCYLREGMVVIDVGAHVGIYTMLSSALVGETGKVYGFEPTPSTYEVLKKNSEKLTNVHIENVAVAAEVGTTSFLDYGPGYGAYNTASTAGGQGLSKEAKNITVPTTTLDTYCRENGVSPTLIKLDAEGFESAILKGSRLILQQNNRRRPLIILEVAGGASWDTNRKDSFSILENAEYVPYSISADGTLTKHLYRDTYTYDNLLFIPNELVTEVTNTVL